MIIGVRTGVEHSFLGESSLTLCPYWLPQPSAQIGKIKLGGFIDLKKVSVFYTEQ